MAVWAAMQLAEAERLPWLRPALAAWALGSPLLRLRSGPKLDATAAADLLAVRDELTRAALARACRGESWCDCGGGEQCTVQLWLAMAWSAQVRGASTYPSLKGSGRHARRWAPITTRWAHFAP